MEQDTHQKMQILDYQIKQLQKVMESIDSQLIEMDNTIKALKEFEKLEHNSEILFPVANGIFAKGKLIDNNMLQINIGSDVIVEKSVNDTIKMMHTQLNDIENYKNEVIMQLQKLIDTMNALQG
ncbi:MAG: prefoldin subunit alpha [Candidatus Woesearchaeota archaeon]